MLHYFFITIICGDMKQDLCNLLININVIVYNQTFKFMNYIIIN